ncbi:hypothetical protein AB182_21790 [Phytobacter ursingii]|uniref:Uncharacterized protein n=1 Tax=Phytobacter ursingii TaxID=1972431 RepID=A0AAC8TNP3_9ENTR|nr:hypothetical protein AB182_21790 [Phytobacter ursingii]
MLAFSLSPWERDGVRASGRTASMFPLTLTLSRGERVLSERDIGFLPLPVEEGIRPQKVSP